MILYYWEGQELDSKGQFFASSDSEAISKMPKDTIILYKDGEEGLEEVFYNSALKVI